MARRVLIPSAPRPEHLVRLSLLENRNFRYCLQFLKNAGERLAAIRLCMDCTGLPAKSALKFVDSLTARQPLDSNRVWARWCPECRLEWHPDTPSCPVCGSVVKKILPGGGR